MTETMGPVKAMRRLFGRYVDFDGRSGRAAYAWAMLLLLIITGGFGLWLRTRTTAISATSIFAADVIFVVMFFTYAILAVPYASLHIRRYRDAGLTPWLLLFTVVLPLIVLLLDNGNIYVNYGAYVLLLVNLVLASLPSRQEFGY